MDVTLTPDVAMVVQTVRAFVEAMLLPQEMQVEHAARIPAAVLREMADLGFFGLPFSEEAGGTGIGFTGYTLALEQLARANAAYGMVLAASGLAGETLARAGTPDQQARWLAPLAAGAVLGAFGLVEEGTGSDGRGLRTTATPAPEGGYRLDGTKSWVLNGPDAGVFVLFARMAGEESDTATGVFVVESGTPGLSLGPRQSDLGLHGLGVCEVRLAACLVPPANRLAALPPAAGGDAGLALAGQVRDRFAVAVGAVAVGLAGRLLEAARDFATQRRQFGRPVGTFGAVQTLLADSAADHFAAQQAVYRAAWSLEQHRPEPALPAMAKLVATESCFRVADRAMQVHGGMGFMKDLWIERGYRDARMLRLLGGTSEELRTTIARHTGCPQE